MARAHLIHRHAVEIGTKRPVVVQAIEGVVPLVCKMIPEKKTQVATTITRLLLIFQTKPSRKVGLARMSRACKAWVLVSIRVMHAKVLIKKELAAVLAQDNAACPVSQTHLLIIFNHFAFVQV